MFRATSSTLRHTKSISNGDVQEALQLSVIKAKAFDEVRLVSQEKENVIINTEESRRIS